MSIQLNHTISCRNNNGIRWYILYYCRIGSYNRTIANMYWT